MQQLVLTAQVYRVFSHIYYYYMLYSCLFLQEREGEESFLINGHEIFMIGECIQVNVTRKTIPDHYWPNNKRLRHTAFVTTSTRVLKLDSTRGMINNCL